MEKEFFRPPFYLLLLYHEKSEMYIFYASLIIFNSNVTNRRVHTRTWYGYPLLSNIV